MQQTENWPTELSFGKFPVRFLFDLHGYLKVEFPAKLNGSTRLRIAAGIHGFIDGVD
jgi:hypothetical protein